MNDPRPRIAHVITNLGDGGAEGVLYRLCNHDDRFDHVVISLMGEGRYAEYLRKIGVPVHCLEMPRGRVTLSGLRKLRALLKDSRPDAVQTWMYHGDLLGGIAARLAGIRNVVWGVRHGEPLKGRTTGTTIAIAHICARLSRVVPRAITCCSRHACSIHVKMGYCENKMRVIPNGYDTDQLRPDEQQRARFREEIGAKDDIPIIGMVARYNAQKDHRNLFRALALLERSEITFRCILIGTDMTAENTVLKAEIERFGLVDKLVLLGPRTDIPTIMNGLDLHVLSSRSEGFPNVVAEAMSCTTPCVVTDAGDAGLIVGDAGWVVPPSNPDALANAIGSALALRRDADEWQVRRDACRSRIVAKFGVGAMVEAFEDCWMEAV